MWKETFQNISDYQRLDYVIRYSSVPVTTRENVSAHSYWVCLYSTLIFNELRPQDRRLLAPLLVSAMMHDFVEGHTGDFVRTFKYSLPELKDAIDKAEELEIEKYPKQIKDLYGMAEDQTSLSDRKVIKAIIKAADFMSLYSYMRKEFLRGNREIKPFYELMMRDFLKMSNMPVVESSGVSFNQGDFYLQLAHAAERTYEDGK